MVSGELKENQSKVIESTMSADKKRMRKKRMKEASLETRQVTVFRRPHNSSLIICAQCACGMLMLEEAVAVSEVSSREIYRRAEAGSLHFKETADGLLLVCLNSLLTQERISR
jgi:hypothetical protein